MVVAHMKLLDSVASIGIDLTASAPGLAYETSKYICKYLLGDRLSPITMPIYQLNSCLTLNVRGPH